MATPEELDLERRKLALEEKKFQETHQLELKKLELEQSKHSKKWLAGVSGIGTILAILFSYMQFSISEATRRQELAVAQAKSQTEDDRLWQFALVDFLKAQHADLFSSDEKKRQHAVALLDASFPPYYSGVLKDKLQVIGGGGASAVAADVVKDLLEPLVKEQDTSKAAFDRWQPNDLETEQVIRQANLTARDLLIEKTSLVPPELRQDALQLVEHYNAWLEEYDRVRGRSAIQGREPYVFAGPRGVPFPREAERRIRAALKERKAKAG